MSKRITSADTELAMQRLTDAMRAVKALGTNERLELQSGNNSYGYAWRVSFGAVSSRRGREIELLTTHGTRKEFTAKVDMLRAGIVLAYRAREEQLDIPYFDDYSFHSVESR